MVQILALHENSYEDEDLCYVCFWDVVFSEEKLDLEALRFFVDFYGKENIRLRCGCYE